MSIDCSEFLNALNPLYLTGVHDANGLKAAVWVDIEKAACEKDFQGDLGLLGVGFEQQTARIFRRHNRNILSRLWILSPHFELFTLRRKAIK